MKIIFNFLNVFLACLNRQDQVEILFFEKLRFFLLSIYDYCYAILS
jgi:hypothetical protein